MIDKFATLNIYFKTVIISLFIFVFGILCFFWTYFFNAGEFINGFLLGGLINTLMYFVLGFTNSNTKVDNISTVVITIIRFILIAGAIVLSGFLSYKKHINLFNIFCVVGGYFIPLAIYAIFYLKDRKK